MTDLLPYRPCVGVMLLNRSDQVFVGQRLDTTLEAWQMPQGGIDRDEDPKSAALRELEEETGIKSENVEVIAAAPSELFYDLPWDMIDKVWGGKWRGQRQHWFLCRFLGEDSDINLLASEPEFRSWRWSDPGDLVAMIVPFKKALYRDVIAAFQPHLSGNSAR